MSEQPNIHTPENWDLASKGYSENIAPQMMGAFAEELTAMLDVNNSHSAIELAAGSGALTMVLGTKVGSLLSTDFSPSMIDILRKKVGHAGMTHVSCEVMDGMNLDVEDDSFDRAACQFGLMLFPDRAAGFSEMKRVLKPGGKAIVSGWRGPDEFEAFGIFGGAVQRAIPDLPKADSPPAIFSLADTESFKAEMEAAGFTDVRVEIVTKVLELGGHEDLWKMAESGAPPMRVLFDKVGEEGKMKVKQALQEIVKERFGDGPVRISNSATVGIGTA